MSLSPNRLIPYLVFLAFSLAVAIGWRVYVYCNECPEGLEHVSRKTRRIAHLQRPLWEFRFAKKVLEELLLPIDREYRDLLDGNVFVLAEPSHDFRRYLAWLASRPDNIFRMLEIAKRLLLRKFPQAVISTEDKAASPTEILHAAIAIQRLYGESVRFERSSRAMLPPEYCERLHRLQMGWTEPIRRAIREVFDFLDEVCAQDFRKESRVEFTIVFDEPENTEEFGAELQQLQTKLPQILEDEY